LVLSRSKNFIGLVVFLKKKLFVLNFYGEGIPTFVSFCLPPPVETARSGPVALLVRIKHKQTFPNYLKQHETLLAGDDEGRRVMCRGR
jgi:hypothetical protein